MDAEVDLTLVSVERDLARMTGRSAPAAWGADHSDSPIPAAMGSSEPSLLPAHAASEQA
jgi:hypothetical protein